MRNEADHLIFSVHKYQLIKWWCHVKYVDQLSTKLNPSYQFLLPPMQKQHVSYHSLLMDFENTIIDFSHGVHTQQLDQFEMTVLVGQHFSDLVVMGC